MQFLLREWVVRYLVPPLDNTFEELRIVDLDDPLAPSCDCGSTPPRISEGLLSFLLHDRVASGYFPASPL
jgi:hypothetical protein